MASANITVLTDDNFKDEVINSSLPVMVDFWATWCGPCKMLAPVVDEIADAYKDKIKVCKLDVDEVGSIAGEYQIMSIPTVLFFKNGEIVEQFTGTRPKETYVNVIKAL